MQLHRPRLFQKSQGKNTQNTTTTYLNIPPNSNQYLISPRQQGTYEFRQPPFNTQPLTYIQPPVNFHQLNHHQTNHYISKSPQKNPYIVHTQLLYPTSDKLKKQNNQINLAKDLAPSNLEIETIVQAMNKSSLKQMSKGEDIKPADMIGLLSRTVMQVNRYSMLYEPKTEDLKHYFRIIQVSESQLFPSSFSISISSSCSNLNSDRKRYQLLISLNGKQLKFQSMTNKNRHFNINLDTVHCEFMESISVSEKQYALKFRVGKKIIEVFVNQSTLPFHLINDQSKIATQYIQRSAKEIAKYLKRSIEKSRGAQFRLNELINKDEEYFNKNYATEEQFAQYCQTGDILLFKDRHTFAKLQRAITNSEYDHVAFVYRHEKYGICLIQSSSGSGVSLTLWTHLVRKHWFRGIDMMTWRRLLIHDKQKDFERKVEEFITINKNKKFGISVRKLLTFHSKKQTEEQQRNRTYFCSQLVATLYKQLGILDDRVSSTQYWPKHFSQKGYMAMLKNSALDKERILVFDQEVLKENYKGYS